MTFIKSLVISQLDIYLSRSKENYNISSVPSIHIKESNVFCELKKATEK